MFDEPREPLALRLRALPRPRVQLEVAVRGVVVAEPHPAQRRSLGAREVAEGLPSNRAAQNSAKRRRRRLEGQRLEVGRADDVEVELHGHLARDHRVELEPGGPLILRTGRG